jgi:nitric oxide synthase oxygenase domain/subunit
MRQDMAIKIMTAVWENAPYQGCTLLTLLALADYANEQGFCWPAITTLAHKSRQSERNTQRCIQQLINDGFLSVKERTQQSSVYIINVKRLAPKRKRR